MTLPPDFKVTTEMLWQGALILTLVDLAFVPLLMWRIGPITFCQLRWTLVATTGVVWGMIWIWALANFWGWR